MFEAVKLDDVAMQQKAHQEGLQVLLPKLNAKPRVYYRGLERWETCFIGGSLSASVDGVVDCVAGADVTLLQNGKPIAVTHSDAFGDFRFGGLAKKSGGYRVEIRHGLGEAQRDCELDESLYLGEIRLVSSHQECIEEQTA
ncbi:Pyrogallol hydroxytransferase small subunit [compost metagenome]